MLLNNTALTRLAVILVLLSVVLGACATGRTSRRLGAPDYPNVKDNKPSIWISDHPRVRAFRRQYANGRTVLAALERGQRYLPTIMREFKSRRLPEELAYLPMLESLFKNRADSGHAKGLWQFTPQTARHMGLRIGMMVDDRLNWRKATRAAAKYLDDLGRKFNYNWALALAGYNGGPNYISQQMRRQRSWNFWELRLRKETSDYVPRFIAMLQVARQKFPHMLVAKLR